jgi:hypothetical protein
VSQTDPILEYATPEPNRAAPARRWVRASIVVAALVVWFLPTMAGASANTSWEHHPFAGAFIILKESSSAADFAFSLGLWACILAPAGYWVLSGRIWAAVVAAIIGCLSIGFSVLAAASASC